MGHVGTEWNGAAAGTPDMRTPLARVRILLLVSLCLSPLACKGNAGGLHVTREGRLQMGGVFVTLAELTPDPATPITLSADADACWMHVQWVLAALGAAGHETVRLQVGDHAARESPVFGGLWRENLWNPAWLEPGALPREGETWREARIEVFEGDPPQFVLSSTWSAEQVRSTEIADVGQWAVSSVQGWTPRERERSEFVVESSGVVPCATVLSLLEVLEEADVAHVAVGLEALHPFDRTLPTLPPPPHREPIVRWASSRDWIRPLRPVNLPVASMGTGDKGDDPDDRVIVTLTAGGRLYKLEFAVRREPSRDRTPAEMERAWAGREIEPVGGLDCKLLCWLPTRAELRPKASFDLRAAAERGERVGTLLRALDGFALEGTEKVDLLGIEPAHESIRHGPPLPPQ